MKHKQYNGKSLRDPSSGKGPSHSTDKGRTYRGLPRE